MTSDKRKPCEECNGEGTVERSVEIGGIRHDAPCDCIFCGGTGYEQDVPPMVDWDEAQ